MYTGIHEIFFAEFPIVLHEWLSRLATRHKNFQEREAIEWSDQLIHEIFFAEFPIVLHEWLSRLAT